jgi:argininosuccinate lyase
VVERLQVDEARLRDAAEQGFSTAVAVADRLVERGVPFRAAHHVVGALVRLAEERDLPFTGLTDDDLRAALHASDDEAARNLSGEAGVAAELRDAAAIDAALARPDVLGGTAPARVAAELASAARRLGLD